MPSKNKSNAAYKYIISPPSPDSPDLRKSSRADKVVPEYWIFQRYQSDRVNL